MKYALITYTVGRVKANIIAKLEEVTSETIIKEFRTLTEAREYYKKNRIQSHELIQEVTK